MGTLKKKRFAFMFATLMFIVHKAQGASSDEPYVWCYQCNNADDNLCGNEFRYHNANSAPTVKCTGQNAACKKVATQGTSKQTVSRSCYNKASPSEDFTGCRDITDVGRVCYCKTNFCNGHGHLQASGLFVTIATFCAFVRSVIY